MSAAEFWSGWWWPAMTAVLGFVFTWLVFRQWLQRRKPHQLAWSVGLLMYAVAALMEAVSEYMRRLEPDGLPLLHRARRLDGRLSRPRLVLPARQDEDRAAHLPRHAARLGGRLPVGRVQHRAACSRSSSPASPWAGRRSARRASFPRIMSLPFNITGTFFLLGGALISIYRFARKREFAYRMWANVLIALGTICIARGRQHGARRRQRRALPRRDGRLGDPARGLPDGRHARQGRQGVDGCRSGAARAGGAAEAGWRAAAAHRPRSSVAIASADRSTRGPTIHAASTIATAVSGYM